MTRTTLRHNQRIHDPRDFQKVYGIRKSVSSANVVLCFAPNGLKISRLGVSVGVKHGNAVKRNRIKRVFRAAFRACRDVLPAGYDYVMIPRQGVSAYNTKDMCAALTQLAKHKSLSRLNAKA